MQMLLPEFGTLAGHPDKVAVQLSLPLSGGLFCADSSGLSLPFVGVESAHKSPSAIPDRRAGSTTGLVVTRSQSVSN